LYYDAYNKYLVQKYENIEFVGDENQTDFETDYRELMGIFAKDGNTEPGEWGDIYEHMVDL
jgi:hypothetical protein